MKKYRSKRARAIIERVRAKYGSARSQQGSSASGCSTAGYDPRAYFRREGASQSAINRHLRSLPKWLKNGEAHVTGAGWVDLITECRGGRLNAGVMDAD